MEKHSPSPLNTSTVAVCREATGRGCVTGTPDSELATGPPLSVMVAIVSNPVAGTGVTVGDLATGRGAASIKLDKNGH